MIKDFQPIVNHKESYGGHEHSVAHSPRGSGTDEDAVEKECRKTTDGDDKYPAHIISGGGDNISLVGEDVQELVAESGIKTREHHCQRKAPDDEQSHGEFQKLLCII